MLVAAARGAPRSETGAVPIQRGAAFFLFIAGRWHEPTDLALDEAAERGRPFVVSARGDGLIAHRQAGPRQPGRTNRRGQVHNTRIPGPEELVCRRHTLIVDGNRPLPALTFLVMWPSCRSSGRAEQ